MRSVRERVGAPPALEVRQLVKYYPRAARPALAGVELRVESGEIFGLLGPNGAGKTTAISICCTLLRPTAGSLSIFDVDVLRQPAEVRRLIGLVPQEIALYPALSLRENLVYFGRLHGLRGRELHCRVEECLELVALREQAGRLLAECSGGMKRRANLAAGILHRPRLLVLDEPTVGIDAQSRNLILENLGRLRESGMTLVYTTHYMEEAEQFCSRVAIVDAGRIIAQGRPGELIREAGCANLETLFLQLTGRQLRD